MQLIFHRTAVIKIPFYVLMTAMEKSKAHSFHRPPQPFWQKKLSQASSGYIIYTDSESFDIGI